MLIDAKTKDIIWAYEVHKSSHGGLLLAPTPPAASNP
jgi:hypothetical protein